MKLGEPLLTVRPWRVLLVDDAADLRFLLRLALEHDGRFSVVGEGTDGHQAIELASVLSPDVIVLDQAMPVMTGLEAIPHLRRAAPKARIVMFSALSGSHAGVKMHTGADAVVEKGSDLADVMSAIVGR